MSKRKRTHHYSYMKLGGIIVAIHHSYWFIIVAVVGAYGAWMHWRNPAEFWRVVDVLIIIASIIIVLAALTVAVIIRRRMVTKAGPKPMTATETWESTHSPTCPCRTRAPSGAGYADVVPITSARGSSDGLA